MRNLTIGITAVIAAAGVLPLTSQQAVRDALGVHALVVPTRAADFVNTSHLASQLPPAGWDAQDPADPVWRAARDAINNTQWPRAAEGFKRIRTESAFRTSTYRGPSFYWEAFARSKMGGSANLKEAQRLLEQMVEDYPEEAKKIRDVEPLLASIEGTLTRTYGDQTSAASLRENVGELRDGCPEDDDDNPKIVALHALMQMDSDDALPILENVLTGRAKCSESLRAQATWMVAQLKSPRAADILLKVAKTDPDSEVRSQAVFWLSQVDGDKAVDALESILQSKNLDDDAYGAAMFALSQNRNPRAIRMLRDFATRSDVPDEARAQAIYWLGNGGGAENVALLKELYSKVEGESREMILHSISQAGTPESAAWLLGIAMDQSQESEHRKMALFWYAQTNAAKGSGPDGAAKLVQMYTATTDRELKEQLIFVYSQNGNQKAYVNKLMDIARTEKDKELRTTAIFWLGQVGSKDPAVAKFLVDIINGN